ncbi:MAG: aminotransferase class V-fold PLP-dependent enzyme [Longimicrobiales bacterium]|nr:aminotransferase class V-fold PLP-dependent enzyme [Longimicrobiales bacterium]
MTTRRRFIERVLAASAGLAVAPPLEAAFGTLPRILPGLTLGDASSEAIDALRAEYLLDPGLLYVNHASIGTIPRAVHEAHLAALRLCETDPWLHMWGPAWEAPREEVRRGLAELLGTDSSSIAITHNTTEGFNQLAAGLDLGPGDEVLYTELNHAGASVCWMHWAERKGFTVRQIPFPVEAAMAMSAEEFAAVHLDHLRPETRVLVFPHIDNRIGVRHPLRLLADGAHARGVEVVAVDGAQTAGMIPCDLEASGVDAFAGSPHKWIQAPKGLGLFYLREALRERLRPTWVTWGQAQWDGTVRRFEDYGTRNLPAVMALGDALDVQEGIGAEAKLSRYRTIHTRLRDAVDATPGLAWRSPRDFELGGSLVAIEVLGRPAPEVGEHLWREHRVGLRSFGNRPNALRISPNVGTTDEEIDRLIHLLTEARP